MKGYRTPRGRTKAWYSRGSRTFSPAQLAELKATGQLLLLCLVGAALLITGCYFWVTSRAEKSVLDPVPQSGQVEHDELQELCDQGNQDACALEQRQKPGAEVPGANSELTK